MYFLTLPILTRLLTPEDFGVVTLALAFPTVAVSLVTAGLTASVPRYFFEYRNDIEKLNSLYFSSQLYLFFMLLVSAVVVYITKDYIAKMVTGKTHYGMALFISYLSTYLAQLNGLYLRVYQNEEKAVLHSMFVVLQVIAGATMSLILVWYFKMSYMGMIYGSFFGAFIAFVSMFPHFNRIVRIHFSRKVLVENIKYGIQVVPKSFTGVINRFFDKYMLNSMLSMSSVGVFSIGQNLANAIDILMSNVWKSFQPVCYREAFDNGDKASTELGRIFTIFAYVGLFPVILAILFAQELVYIIAPSSYEAATNIIIILSAGITTQTFGRYVGVQYAYSKRPFWIFPVAVVGTIFNVVLNILLIPEYGLIGAAFATMIATFITNGILIFIGQKLFKIDYQWGIIVVLFLNILTAMAVVLYLRGMIISNVYLYLVKTILLAGFVFIGFRAKIITTHSIKKVTRSFLKIPFRVKV